VIEGGRRLAADMEALRPTMDAFRRGTKRSRLRLTQVVCPKGHTLLEVFPTRGGPVALWARRERVDIRAGEAHDRWTQVWEADHLDGLPALAWCPCHDNIDLDLAWVAGLVAAGKRRALAPVLDASEARHTEVVDGIEIRWS
jgi:hypothetical protein